MKQASILREMLISIDRKSYPAYKSLKGEYKFSDYILSIDHVQGDPFAAPSHLTVSMTVERSGFPERYISSRFARTSLADFLLRQFRSVIERQSFQSKGSGKSGLIAVSHCGQEILERTACQISDKEIIVRFHVGFPARGRTIDAKELEKILFSLLPESVRASFFYKSLDAGRLEAHMYLREDQAFIRKSLDKMGLAAFVANGAVLPRESGVSSKPMKDSVPFISPASLQVEMELPHKGKIIGMGIPRGVTLITGGGYHGKSTLLSALQNGIYDHIRGDGREYVVTDMTACKLKAEDGRFVKDVDISLFINNLPNHKDTHRFSTADASGSTSQAAGILESVESGSRLFLMDEDTSAANFMVRDAFMQRVVSPEKEPITPFLERIRDFQTVAGISTILVAGSSGAFFHVADTVIQMDEYKPLDITEKVKALLPEYPVRIENRTDFVLPENPRVMTRHTEPKTKKNYYGERVESNDQPKIRLHGKDGFSLGRQDVDLKALEQLCDTEQTAALAFLLAEAYDNLVDGKRTVTETIRCLEGRLAAEGLSFFKVHGYVSSGYVMPRIQDIYSCFNRYRRA